jgi:hypothetical protein
LKDEPTVSVVWCERCVCRCKRRFEYLLGRPLRAEVLECALLGDTLCRFAVQSRRGCPGSQIKRVKFLFVSHMAKRKADPPSVS